MNTTTKNKGAGRGRTKGSFSFIAVRVGDILAQVGENAEIPLSRKWAEAIGLKNTGESKSSIQILKQTAIPSSDATATTLQVSVED